MVQQRHELDAATPLLRHRHVITQLDGAVRLDDDLGGPRTVVSHSPNCAALDTVADRHTKTPRGG